MKTSFDCIIEMPSGSTFKYEALKRPSGLILTVDRPLKIEVPCNYGYINNTLAPDGDPLDIFIIGTQPIYPLTLCKVEILHGLTCYDNGVSDDKIIGVLTGLDREVTLAEKLDWNHKIITYLETYKTGFKVDQRIDEQEALNVIKQSFWRANNEA